MISVGTAPKYDQFLHCFSADLFQFFCTMCTGFRLALVFWPRKRWLEKSRVRSDHDIVIDQNRHSVDTCTCIHIYSLVLLSPSPAFTPFPAFIRSTGKDTTLHSDTTHFCRTMHRHSKLQQRPWSWVLVLQDQRLVCEWWSSQWQRVDYRCNLQVPRAKLLHLWQASRHRCPTTGTQRRYMYFHPHLQPCVVIPISCVHSILTGCHVAKWIYKAVWADMKSLEILESLMCHLHPIAIHNLYDNYPRKLALAAGQNLETHCWLFIQIENVG